MPAGPRKPPAARKASQRLTKAAKPKATRAAARAKQAAAARGALGPTHRGQLDRHQKALRDSAIMAAIHADMPRARIAKEFGVALRTVHRIHADFRLASSPLEKRPMEIVEEVVRIYRQQIVDFARHAAVNATSNPTVALGAMRAAAEALERYTTLMGDIGKLPDNLELFRAESEMIRIAELMFERTKECERGDLSPGELGEFFRDLMTSRQPLGTYEAPAGSVRELAEGAA